MKYTITVMKCSVCGKRFKEYEGLQYHDHVERFSDGLIGKENSIVFNEKNLIFYTNKISCYDNGILRDKEDMECRLNCFLKAKSVTQELKEAVKKEVSRLMGKKEEIDNRFSQVYRDFVKSLSREDLDIFYSHCYKSLYGKISILAEEEICSRLVEEAERLSGLKIGDKVKIVKEGDLFGAIGKVKKFIALGYRYPAVEVDIVFNNVDKKGNNGYFSFPFRIEEVEGIKEK